MTPDRTNNSRLSTLLGATLLAATLCPAKAALTDGLIAFWPMQTITEGKMPDAISENDLNVVGNPAAVSGMMGGAFQLDGSSTYFTNLHSAMPAPSLPIYRSGGYSVAMWVKGPPQTGKYLLTEGQTTSTAPLFLLQTGQAGANNNKFDALIRTDGGATLLNHAVSSAVVFDDTWHHIAWVDVDGTVQLYVDGFLDATSFNYTAGGALTLDTTAIGTLVRDKVSTGNVFNGAIDDVAVWDRALSEAEVMELITTGIPVTGEVLPPVITADLPDVTRQTGDWALFSVTLSGTGPFTYQWFKNGEAIPDATSETYRVLDLTTENSGEAYSVEASNAAGTATSRSAILTVLADPAPDVRAGILNYWPLDEINQEGALLLSPDLYSGNDMVLAGFFDPSEVVPGQEGNALLFDSVSYYAWRTNGSPIYNQTNFSISMWVKAPYESQNDRRIFSEGSSQNNTPLFTLGTDPQGDSPSLSVFIRGDSGTAPVPGRASTRPVFDDTWHHIVWTDANGDARLYVDGVLDETDYSYARPAMTMDVTSLGAVLRAIAGNFYYGVIDEVTTWNRALTWTEVQQVMSEGIPEPAAAIPPLVTSQPEPRTNGVFTGDEISFAVQYSGTLPINFQWFKDGTAIPAAQNASAATPVLQLQDVTLSSVGDYYAILSNSGGSATSSVARLDNITSFTPKTAGEVLNLDLGLITAPNVQPGFQEFYLQWNGTNYDGVGITFSGVGGANLDSRNRSTGSQVANNPPTMTQAQIYNDFIFANSSTDGAGMRIRIHRLAPNTPHELTLWSFDPHSTGDRYTDWSETSSGTAIPIQTGYVFNGSTLPTTDLDNTTTAILTSSAEGELVIEGLRNGGTGVAAFVNAIRLVANPAVGILEITGAQLLNGNVRITIDTPEEGQVVSLEQSGILNGAWEAASNVTAIETNGSTTVLEVPASTPHMFYRAVVAP